MANNKRGGYPRTPPQGSRIVTTMSFEEYAARAVRSADPDTSWLAAFARLGGKASDRRQALRCHYEAAFGLTDFELGDAMGRQQTSAGKRRGELRDDGLIEDSGMRRAAPSGSAAIVWRITNKGRDVYQRIATKATSERVA